MFASHLATPADQAPERDLACVDLWERSLERSRRRRDLAALHRKHAPRRKAGSLALSAALLASPLVPLASAQSGGSGGTTTEESEPSDGERVLAGDAILRFGDTGAAVVAVQQKLAVDDDGIFGPITEGAVESFQDRVGLPVTGEVDSRTWTELFRATVSFVPAGSPQAKAIQASVSSEEASSEEASSEESSSEEASSEVRAASAEPAASTDEDRESSRSPEPSRGVQAHVHDAEPGETNTKAPEKGKKKKLEAREGGARPEAGVDKSTEKPDPVVDVTEKVVEEVAPPVAGDCATGKLAAPTQGTVTSTFGDGRNHAGVDIANKTGTPIYAALCGTVTEAGVQGGYGNIICIRHTSSFSTCYAHLSSFNTREGEYVKVGQVIGRMGSTGRSTGPHLHFETRVNGQAQDPDSYMSGERTVSGSSSGEARATSNEASASGTQEAQASAPAAQEAPASASGTQEAQDTGTGGGPASAGAAQGSGSQAQPAQEQPAPAQEQPAPAQEQPAPAPEQPAAAQDQTAAPVAAPAPSGAVAAPVEAAPEAGVTAPASTAEAPADPVEEATAAVEQATAPVEQAAAPVQEAAAPVEQAVAPVTQAAAPVEDAAAAAVEQAVAPVAEAAAPAVPGAAG